MRILEGAERDTITIFRAVYLMFEGFFEPSLKIFSQRWEVGSKSHRQS